MKYGRLGGMVDDKQRRLDNKRFNEQIKALSGLLNAAGLTVAGAYLITPFIQSNAYRPTIWVFWGGAFAIAVGLTILLALRSEE